MAFKVTIIGAGQVGSTIAYSLTVKGIASEIVMIDINTQKALGEALDIRQGTPFCDPVTIYAGTYADAKDSDIVVLTSGVARKPGQSRLDLAQTNVDITKSIIPEIIKYASTAIYVIVSNPVDILTYTAVKLSGLPENRVFGSGTVLDTARLKYLLGEHLSVDSRSVHAFIIGEHGDSEIAAWSCANVSGIKLDRFCDMRGFHEHEDSMRRIAEEVKNSAYEIIEKKKATYYGVAMAVRRICQAISRDEKSILPVSTIQHGAFGIEGVALSMPAVVGKDGVETQVPLELDEKEREALLHSAKTLKNVIDESVCL